MKKINILLVGSAAILAAYASPVVEKMSEKTMVSASPDCLFGEIPIWGTDVVPGVDDLSGARPVVASADAEYHRVAKAVKEGTVFFEPFETEADFKRFTVIDANKDGKTWDYVAYYKAPRLSCHDTNRSDDWMITPAIRLQKGKLYRFTIDLRVASKNSPEEYFEVKAGTSPAVEGMTQEVIPETKILFPGYDENSQIPYTTFSGFVNATEDGDWYIGLHGLSHAEAWGFYAVNFTLYEGVEAAGPDNVTDFKAEAAAGGEYRAAISFRAPTTNTLGEEITAISSIKVSRNDSVIRDIKSPATGSLIEFTDTLPANGTYTYKAVPFNAMGEGKPAEVSVYVGTDVPASPSFVNLAETSVDGRVRLTWGAVTTDTASNPIAPSKITYTIGRISNQGTLTDIVENITATEYEFQAVPEGKQELLQYAVLARTEGGYSIGVSSEGVPAGTPYTIPWKESFPNATLSCVMGTQTITGQCQWSISRDESFQNMQSADGDNGYASFWSTKTGDQARMYTGKFRIVGMENPAVSFYIYKHRSDTPDIGTIEVEINDGSGFKTISTVMAEPYPIKGWNKVFVRIPDEYKGRVIRLGFKATNVTYTYQFIDALAIEDMKPDNISAVKLDAPVWVEPGKDFSLTATYVNNGIHRAENYSVSLIRDGVVVQSIVGNPIEPGASASVSFTENIDSSAGKEPSYVASVVFESDTDDSDNDTEAVTVHNLISNYPSPTDLSGSFISPGKALLKWSAPDYSTVKPEVFTDDFESYPSFANSLAGEWTFCDLDKGKIGGLNDGNQEIVIPGIAMNSCQAWWVMDRTASSLASIRSFAAYSGDKYLAQQYITGGASCDDWAVSPEICADAQTISFYARSFSADDLESLEVLVSEGSRAPEDFKTVKTFTDMSSQWSRYTVDLPAGSRRFALRCVSNYKFMLFIDDVSYIPAGNTGLVLEGYNVYRDGKRLNETPVTLTSFTDETIPTDRASVYYVSAVYGKGESPVSEKYLLEYSGVGDVRADDVSVFASDSSITVKGAAGVSLSVTATDGTVLYRGYGCGNDVIRVSPGIYVVTAGRSTFKVVVK